MKNTKSKLEKLAKEAERILKKREKQRNSSKWRSFIIFEYKKK